MFVIRPLSIIRSIISSLMCLLSMTSISDALEVVSGEAIQGGMVIVKTAPGFTITVDGAPLMVSDNGHAVIGFHRDDTETVILKSYSDDALVSRISLTPQRRQYKEQRINGLPKTMVTPPENVLLRIKRDRKSVIKARSYETSITAFLGEFDWPSHGIITGVYGSRRVLNDQPRTPHYGIDIAAPIGTTVIAPQSGIIRMVDDLYYTGWTIILDHGHGVSSTFLHLNTTSMQVGKNVQKGDVIGTVGSTGRSTGPHLDWRINWFEKRLDPALLVGPMPTP